MPKIFLPATYLQRQFLSSILDDPFYEQVGYGGARGGGKTFASAAAMIIRRLRWAETKGLMLRQLQDAADENIGAELRNVFKIMQIPTNVRGGVRWLESRKSWEFPNGSVIKLGYCKKKDDWEKYQGQQYTDINFEEATQFEERPFVDIIGSNRNNTGEVGGKVWITCNPGGIGTQWVKRRFIDSTTRDKRTLWIKATLRDNKAMLVNDPGYRDRVLGKQPEWRRKQWEEGDWDAKEGQFFIYNPERVVRKVEIPYWASVASGVDAGYYPSAFAVVWVARWKENGRTRIHVTNELKRHRLNTRQQAQEALAVEEFSPVLRQHEIYQRFADPAAWKMTENNAGMTAVTAHAWGMSGMPVAPAYTNARAAGWLLLRTLIDEDILTIDPSCMALLKEMEDAVHDDKSDDIADGTEDHLLDALRYVLVSIFAGAMPERKVDPYERVVRSKGVIVLRP
jgi:phage terminase large subunit